MSQQDATWSTSLSHTRLQDTKVESNWRYWLHSRRKKIRQNSLTFVCCCHAWSSTRVVESSNLPRGATQDEWNDATREHKTFPEVANLSKIQQSESSHRRTEYRQVVFIIVEEVNIVIVPFFEVAMLPCHYLQPFLLSRQKQNSHFYFPAKSKIAISTFPPKAK